MGSLHPQLQLVSGAAGTNIGIGARRPFLVIGMNEPTGTKKISGCLPPLIKTKADVIEPNAIGIKTFTIGSKYRNLLRREVQYLTELHFLLPDLFLGRLTLSDVDDSTGVLNEIPGRAENRMTNTVNVPDGATRMHDAIIHSFVRLVIYGSLGRLPERRLIVGMNSLDEFFHSGRTIAWIKTQNAATFLRPIPGVGVRTPGPTAGLAQPLRFRQVRFTSSEGLVRALLFAQVEYAGDALVRILKQRASQQHGQAAAIFPEQLLLVWLKKPGCQCLCHGTLVAFAQFGRRHIRPAQSARDEILTVVLQHL